MAGLLGNGLAGFAMNPATTYGAFLDDSHWQTSSSALVCELAQQIPEFGEGRFEKRAGETLQFKLRPYVDSLPPGPVQLVAESPMWKPDLASQSIATVEATDHIVPVQLKGLPATMMLAHLQRGMMPSFIGDGRPGEVKVVLSSVNFQPAYQEYVGCLSQLLPVTFKQIARSAIFFDTNQTSLSGGVQEQLDLIVRYVKADKSIRRIFVDGHTDNVGNKQLNRKISQQRAAAVIDYFKAAGVEDDLLVTRYHGGRYPALTNDSPENRARNRRVTIRLER